MNSVRVSVSVRPLGSGLSPEVGKLLHTRNGESEPSTKPGSQVVQADVQAEPYTKTMLMTAKEQFLPVGIQKGGQND